MNEELKELLNNFYNKQKITKKYNDNFFYNFSKKYYKLIHSIKFMKFVLCIKNGANPNIQNDDGSTALILASEWDTEAVIQLLEVGADPNIRNYYGRTALDRSILHNPEAIIPLLEAGADPYIEDPYAENAFKFAKTYRKKKSFNILNFYSSKMYPNLKRRQKDRTNYYKYLYNHLNISDDIKYKILEYL